ncbi:Cell division protein ZapC [Vibrio aerogenes CECT 7868]|uniref:Cell division protein ZapC n=2 Tax=Vibrio aerogenes TaxID=92172 RepID=A0A1M5Z5L3_9VIBR|nr:Cell division protein ZapC [Vibrio aerogenes CECT 7868]
MLDLGDDMLFRTLLPRKVLVTCAFASSQFTVEDAADYQLFLESLDGLNYSGPRLVELVLNCVASKRFHKPVQPKSWFFEPRSADFTPKEGNIVQLTNQFNQGRFIVLDVGENASLCLSAELEPFILSPGKELVFGQAIKVMHDRMECVNSGSQKIALVG